jgi:hypothetical protein
MTFCDAEMNRKITVKLKHLVTVLTGQHMVPISYWFILFSILTAHKIPTLFDLFRFQVTNCSLVTHITFLFLSYSFPCVLLSEVLRDIQRTRRPTVVRTVVPRKLQRALGSDSHRIRTEFWWWNFKTLNYIKFVEVRVKLSTRYFCWLGEFKLDAVYGSSINLPITKNLGFMESSP